METHQSFNALERRGSNQTSAFSAVREDVTKDLWGGGKLQVLRPDWFACPDN